jgi:hypothetical protein
MCDGMHGSTTGFVALYMNHLVGYELRTKSWSVRIPMSMSCSGEFASFTRKTKLMICGHLDTNRTLDQSPFYYDQLHTAMLTKSYAALHLYQCTCLQTGSSSGRGLNCAYSSRFPCQKVAKEIAQAPLDTRLESSLRCLTTSLSVRIELEVCCCCRL